MVTFSHLELCENFSANEPFATAFFSKNEGGKSLFASASMQNRLYTFGLVLRGFDTQIQGLFGMAKDVAKQQITALFQNQPTDGIECYDITLLEVTDGKYKSVKFGENKLETFHRAYIGTHDECLNDLKRQYAKQTDWVLEEA